MCLHVHIWSVLEDGLPNNPYVPLRLDVSSCNQKWPLVGLPSRLPVLHSYVLCLSRTSLSNRPIRAHKYGEENGSNVNAKFVQHHMHIRKPFGQSLPFLEWKFPWLNTQWRPSANWALSTTPVLTAVHIFVCVLVYVCKMR